MPITKTKESVSGNLRTMECRYESGLIEIGVYTRGTLTEWVGPRAVAWRNDSGRWFYTYSGARNVKARSRKLAVESAIAAAVRES